MTVSNTDPMVIAVVTCSVQVTLSRPFAASDSFKAIQDAATREASELVRDKLANVGKVEVAGVRLFYTADLARAP